MLTEFSLSIASELVSSEDQFPVDFNQAWTWLGYSMKRDAKQFLLKNFSLDFDYVMLQPELGTLAVPRPSERIYLTVEAFKMFAMMAGTKQGKEVRKYFLECERIAKSKTQIQLPDEVELATLYLEAAIEKKRLAAELVVVKAQLEEQAPKVLLAKELLISKHANVDIGEYSRLTYDAIKLGRNKLFDKLRELNIFMEEPKRNLPYQYFMDKGYFEVIQVARGTTGYYDAKVLVTPLGQEYLLKKLTTLLVAVR